MVRVLPIKGEVELEDVHTGLTHEAQPSAQRVLLNQLVHRSGVGAAGIPEVCRSAPKITPKPI